ncbi:polysaccharide biosynthesis protein [Christiangramia fulva]|uniref:polysaccharide biosynthesis protein n=1 Tax=Christiangramia fulva TaxID=2126553 RepID=UPI001875D0AA|nr:polysaccharide biosynthesis protein [Christiangramia fulva]
MKDFIVMHFLTTRLAKIKDHPRYDYVLGWGKLISYTGGAQILVQAVGFLSGLLIIRLLPVEEYAYYTLANTMLGTMTLLADGGINAGVLAEGSKVWKDKNKLSTVLKTGLELRKKFAIVSLLISLPILFLLLRDLNADNLTTLLIILSIIPAFFAALSDQLLEIVPKLHQEIKSLQVNQGMVASLRLLLLGLLIFIFPLTYVAILAAGISRMYGNYKLKNIASPHLVSQSEKSPAVRRKILKVVYRMFPGVLYYCFSGQITIWIISIFGTTSSLAGIGALGRLSVMLSIFTVAANLLIVPRFARLPSEQHILRKRLDQITMWLVLLFSFALAFVYFFSKAFLFLLGDSYRELGFELTLSFAGACLAAFSAILFNIATSKGWVLNPAFSICVGIISIILGVFLFEISTLNGVLLYSIFISGIQVVQNGAFLYYKIFSLSNHHKSPERGNFLK